MKESTQREQLLKDYQATREVTNKLCSPLVTEDYVIQSMEDVSPPKWHLAHTTWFFETFILSSNISDYQVYNPLFPYLFNSYYQTIGTFHPRMRRGILSRPTVETIFAYRQYVDEMMIKLIANCPHNQLSQIAMLVTLGLHHEQQHQELLLTDIKYNFSLDPSFPVYQGNDIVPKQEKIMQIEFIPNEGGLVEIGHNKDTFCFDNELPRHKVFLAPFAIASRLVTNGEYLQFMKTDGYQNSQWWLSDGWDLIQRQKWFAPLYWRFINDEWYQFTLNGLKKLNLSEPVSHISYYEADAYARYVAARLPSETEWEHYVQNQQLNPVQGNFLDTEHYHPLPVTHKQPQFFGDVWEWTNSAYLPYPGYQSLYGALGEYNGKFMSNQMVLRGGSCLTARSHIRNSYRNFFQPDKRWQFTGIRLAKHI